MGLRKLSRTDEAEIYYLYNYGSRIRTQDELAKFYGVSQQAVGAALQRFKLLLANLKNAEYEGRLREFGQEISEARLSLIRKGAISNDAPIPQITYED